jgi:hypothetical protein
MHSLTLRTLFENEFYNRYEVAHYTPLASPHFAFKKFPKRFSKAALGQQGHGSFSLSPAGRGASLLQPSVRQRSGDSPRLVPRHLL